MAFSMSPSVDVKETDLSAIIPGVSSSVGAFAGAFVWGPVDSPVRIDNEHTLVDRLGKPNAETGTSFFTAASFLAYTNNMLVARSVDKSIARNACVGGEGVFDANANVTVYEEALILNDDHYLSKFSDGSADVGEFAAKYPGELGNSIRISIADANTFGTWGYADLFDGAPSTSIYTEGKNGQNDELHVIVIDELGLWTGTPGTILEKFQFLSKASDARQFDGTSLYYKTVLNNRSKYIWWMDHPADGNNWGSSAFQTTFDDLNAVVDSVLTGGVDGNNPTDGNLIATWNLFKNDEKYDISIIPTGAASETIQKHVIQNIAEVRKDCIVTVSPPLSLVLDNVGNEADAIVGYRDNLPSTSYAVMESGWKYQYDQYNDDYIYVPLNGDIAGTMAQTDYTNDPWWSPAGLARGQIKNSVRLAYSPNKTDRDVMYPKGINPVVTFPGQGTVLFGDRTMLSRPSAFDRINVRRLFIVLEKAISTYSRNVLFNFNDVFTRLSFVNAVNPFLRDVQGRRGIQDFKVVCDESNNTPEVIDRNEFVATIMIKPNRSINVITLNFVATRSGVSFEEVIGEV